MLPPIFTQFAKALESKGFNPKSGEIYARLVFSAVGENAASPNLTLGAVTAQLAELGNTSRHYVALHAFCDFVINTMPEEVAEFYQTLRSWLYDHRRRFRQTPAVAKPRPSQSYCRALLNFALEVGHPFAYPFALVAFCGLRCTEACNLIKSQEVPSGFITVFGKGRKSRQVPVPAFVTALAEDYNGDFYDDREFRHQLAEFQNDYARRELLAPQIFTPHDFRHAYACMLLENHTPEHIIQMWLGHSSSQTTGIYLQNAYKDRLPVP